MRGKKGVKRGGSRNFSRNLRPLEESDYIRPDPEDTDDSEVSDSNSEESGSESGSASGSGSESSEEEEVKPVKKQNLIETSNPNRDQKKNVKLSDLGKDLAKTSLEDEGMSRREREALEAQRKKEAYMKLHLAGKTDQAKADMARLAEIRKQREEAAKRREAESQAKNDAKAQSLAAGKSIISKTLGSSTPVTPTKKR